MPPSGFPKPIRKAVRSLLRGCSDELKNEVVVAHKYPNLDVAVQEEQQNISSVLVNPKTPPGVIHSMLELPGAYYDFIAGGRARGLSFDDAVEAALDRVDDIVAKIHINEQRELVECEL